MRHGLKQIMILCALVWMQQLFADQTLVQQKNTQTFIRDLVKNDSFERKKVRDILSKAVYKPKIIAAMERPYEKKNWDVYRARFLTPARLNAGLDFWRNNQKTLQKVEQEYGVPAEVIVAIIGVETSYGKQQGSYRVLDALTTLAFFYPKRADYFKRELREFLLLCREHGVPATEYVGSYAGAMGKPQFMPSNYRTYALDFMGKGQPNLMKDDSDAILSVANYFKRHGWQTSQMVAEPVQVPNKNAQELSLNARSPNYTFTQLLQAGVQPHDQQHSHPKEAGLLALITDKGPEYWVAYPNFYVITRYNTSPQYALVVYLLSQSLREHYRHV